MDIAYLGNISTNSVSMVAKYIVEKNSNALGIKFGINRHLLGNVSCSNFKQLAD